MMASCRRIVPHGDDDARDFPRNDGSRRPIITSSASVERGTPIYPGVIAPRHLLAVCAPV